MAGWPRTTRVTPSLASALLLTPPYRSAADLSAGQVVYPPKTGSPRKPCNMIRAWRIVLCEWHSSPAGTRRGPCVPTAPISWIADNQRKGYRPGPHADHGPGQRDYSPSDLVRPIGRYWLRWKNALREFKDSSATRDRSAPPTPGCIPSPFHPYPNRCLRLD